MLKKLLAGASAIALGMVVAADAMAECDGIYLGIRGGVAKPDIGASHTSGDRLKIDDNLFMLSGAIGYRYTYFRAEFEYIWRDQSRDSETITTTIPGRPDPIVSTSVGEFDYDSYMRNRDVYLNFRKDIPGVITGDVEEVLQAIERHASDPDRQMAFRDQMVSPSRSGSYTGDVADFFEKVLAEYRTEERR